MPLSPPLLRLFLLFLLSLLSACARLPPVVSGTLAGDVHWQGQVLLAGDVILPADASLTIAAGTQVIFLPAPAGFDQYTEHPYFPGSELIVRGRLLAEGSADLPIVFRHQNPTAPAGSWGGINIEGSPQALFRYCFFTQADSAVHSRDAAVRIEQSIFEQNLVAVRFHSTALTLRRSLLRSNGTGVRFHFGAPTITDNDLLANGRAFFITSHPDAYHIAGNNIIASHDYQVVLGEEVPEDVDLTGNYWGEVAAPRIEEQLLDGRRFADLGLVRYQPFVLQPFTESGPTWNR